MAYDRKDHYYRLAKKEGRASRAVYKLKQLNERFSLIRRGDKVVDLGSAPGSWLKEISNIAGPRGKVVGIDILPIKIQLSGNAKFLLANINDNDSMKKISEEIGGKADAIFSDMAPNLTGISFRDAYLSYELGMMALEVCRKILKSGGNFAVKIFPGDELDGYKKMLQENFEKVTAVIPPATRKTSSELYIVAQGMKHN